MEITLPTPPKTIHREGNLAVFEVENLYPGYGITLGNAVRRVLLSSLPGAAVTLMKVTGADHEFTTIPGVLEDAIALTMNVKQIRFRLFGDEPQTARLRAKGERKATAADIEVPPQLEVVNKGQHIATLTNKKGELDIEFTVERGVGYVPVEMMKREKLPIGAIAVDAIFNPVRRVNFSVENMRVGERTNFNRLRIDVETDGSLTPEDAFLNAINILGEQFSRLVITPPEPETKQEEAKSGDILKTPIEKTELSTRVKNALAAGGIKTVGGLAKKKREDVAGLSDLGGKALEEIEKFLADNGLSFKA